MILKIALERHHDGDDVIQVLHGHLSALSRGDAHGRGDYIPNLSTVELLLVEFFPHPPHNVRIRLGLHESFPFVLFQESLEDVDSLFLVEPLISDCNVDSGLDRYVELRNLVGRQDENSLVVFEDAKEDWISK